MGFRIASFINIPYASIAQIFIPIAGRLIGVNNKAELNQLYKIVTVLILIASAIMFGGIFFMKKEVIQLFGPEYQDALDIVVVILIAEMVSINLGLARNLIVICGNSKMNLINSIISILLMVLLSLWLIPEYGIMGAAIAFAVAKIVLNVTTIVQLYWFYNLSPFSIKYGLILGIFLILFISGVWIDSNPYITASIFFGAFTSIIYFFIMNHQEKGILTNFLKQKEGNNHTKS